MTPESRKENESSQHAQALGEARLKIEATKLFAPSEVDFIVVVLEGGLSAKDSFYEAKLAEKEKEIKRLKNEK